MKFFFNIMAAAAALFNFLFFLQLVFLWRRTASAAASGSEAQRAGATSA